MRTTFTKLPSFLVHLFLSISLLSNSSSCSHAEFSAAVRRISPSTEFLSLSPPDLTVFPPHTISLYTLSFTPNYHAYRSHDVRERRRYFLVFLNVHSLTRSRSSFVSLSRATVVASRLQAAYKSLSSVTMSRATGSTWIRNEK